MKEYTYDLEASKAISVANLCAGMKGEAKMKLLRKKLMDRVIEIWPEFDKSNEEAQEKERPLLNTKRKLIIKSKWLRAYAVGIEEMISDKETNGQDVVDLLASAKDMRISNWIEKRIAANDVEDFNEEMDGEEGLADKPEEETVPEKETQEQPCA
jgi:hypothetical protein